MEQLGVGSVQVVRVLGAALLQTQEGALQMDPGHLGPIGGAPEIADSLHGLGEDRLLQRHGGGAPGSDAASGIVAGHLHQALRAPVAGVLVHGPVGVDVDEPRDQIGAMQIDPAGHRRPYGLDDVGKLDPAGHEPAVQEYVGVGYLVHFLSSRMP